MNYKSLNSAIRSVTNPQPKNEALTSLQENIDLFNAVHPYTVGLQSVIVLAMMEALLDGSGPISGTVSLFKNLMKKWKARVLGGKLSADQAQSFIAEYEKLAASLPTGKRNFLKASLNKMEQAAKAGDKSKLGAIATEVKNYLSRNSAEVKEDYQTPGRAAETKRLRMRAKKEVQVASRKYQAAQDTEWNEKESPNTYGTKGKVVKPTKKMLKTRGASQKAQETKRINAGKKYREWDNARKETERKNLQTPQGRAIHAASKAQGQRNDLGW